MKKAPPGPVLSTDRRSDSLRTGRGISLDSAQDLAIGALVFLAADPEKVGSFATASGLNAENLRVAAESPEFLAAVLDYLASDESLLLAFAVNSNVDPADVQRARAVLSPRMEE